MSILPKRPQGKHASNRPVTTPGLAEREALNRPTMPQRVPGRTGGNWLPSPADTTVMLPALEISHEAAPRQPLTMTTPAWTPPADTDTIRRIRDGLRALPDTPPLEAPRFRVHRLPPPPVAGRRLPARQAVAMMPAVRYPGYDGTPAEYASAMRHVSRITGTFSPLEKAREWPRHAIENTAEVTP